MELNINSPAYYTKEFGVDNEIYWMCRRLSALIEKNNYSGIINVIGIVPIVAPRSWIEKGLWKEKRRCDLKYGVASVSLHIDYDEYVKADISEKKKLMINNILSSVKSISKRAKLDYKSFENDVKKFCKVEQIIL